MMPRAVKLKPVMRLRTIILAAFAVILTWLVISRSLAAYLANIAPQTAVWLNPRQPEALINLASRSLYASAPALMSGAEGADQTSQNPKPDDSGSPVVPDPNALGGAPKGDDAAASKKTNDAEASQNLKNTFESVGQNPSIDLAAVRAWAESTLIDDPLNATALRILGQVASVAGDGPATMKFMEASAQLSLHETTAVYWLMRKSQEAGDYKVAISYSDALLRTDPDSAPYVVPVLAHFAENKQSNGSVKEILNANPPWRHLFFALLPRSVTDARTPLDLLLAVKAGPIPPTSNDLHGYLDALIQHKLYSLAYYAWLQFLTPEELNNAGLLFNGNFQSPPSGMPFDWVITQGSGVTIDIVPRADNKNEHALLVDFLYGRVDYHSVSELLVLAPGDYQFGGKYKGELLGPRGLNWRLVCVEAVNKPIGESPVISGISSTWKDVGFTFTVPATGCHAQYVRLDLDARTASEQLITGSMLFDELQISRITEGADAADDEDSKQ